MHALAKIGATAENKQKFVGIRALLTMQKQQTPFQLRMASSQHSYLCPPEGPSAKGWSRKNSQDGTHLDSGHGRVGSARCSELLDPSTLRLDLEQ